MSEAVLVLCTCPDRVTALDLAGALVERRLAACVNVTSPVTSVYLWKGEVEGSDEHLLLIKTTAQRYPDLQAEIRSRHPYELPEIVAIPIQQGLTDYLQWVEQCTTPSS